MSSKGGAIGIMEILYVVMTAEHNKELSCSPKTVHLVAIVYRKHEAAREQECPSHLQPNRIGYRIKQRCVNALLPNSFLHTHTQQR